MKAFFADIKETGLVPDRGAKAWGTQLALPTPEQQQRQEELKSQVAAARASARCQDGSAGAATRGWEKRTAAASRCRRTCLARGSARPPRSPRTARCSRSTTRKPVDYTIYEGGTLASNRGPGNGLVVASGPNPDTETYTVTFEARRRHMDGPWPRSGAGREPARHPRGPRRRPRGRSPSSRPRSTARRAAVLHRHAAISAVPVPEYPPDAAFDGDPKTGWAEAGYSEIAKPFLALRFAKPVKTDAAAVMTVRIRQDSPLRRATSAASASRSPASEYSWPTAEKGKEIPGRGPARLRRCEEDKRTAAQKTAIADAFPVGIAGGAT